MSWLTAFKVIPWRDLVENAPTVVRGARKLWGLVAKSGAAAQPPAAVDPEGRLAALEREVANLQEQAGKAATLIAELAEHNARLVAAVEVLRLRTRILLIAGCAVVVVFGAIWAVSAVAQPIAAQPTLPRK